MILWPVCHANGRRFTVEVLTLGWVRKGRGETVRVLPIKTARMYCGGKARRLPHPDYVRNEQKFGAK